MRATSDYNITGKSFTWKALADCRATDWLRFRGGFNRAERSPNVGELYSRAVADVPDRAVG